MKWQQRENSASISSASCTPNSVTPLSQHCRKRTPRLRTVSIASWTMDACKGGRRGEGGTGREGRRGERKEEKEGREGKEGGEEGEGKGDYSCIMGKIETIISKKYSLLTIHYP